MAGPHYFGRAGAAHHFQMVNGLERCAVMRRAFGHRASHPRKADFPLVVILPPLTGGIVSEPLHGLELAAACWQQVSGRHAKPIGCLAFFAIDLHSIDSHRLDAALNLAISNDR